MRRSAALDATWRGATAPALAERLEADHGTGHADVERLGPPRHGDAQGTRERSADSRDRGRRTRCPGRPPMGTDQSSAGIVLAVPHDRGQRAEAGGRQFDGERARVGPHGQGHVEEGAGRGAHRLGVVGIDGIAGVDDQRRPRGVRRPQHGAGVARIAHVDEDHDQRTVPGGPGTGLRRRLLQHGEHRQHRLGRDRVGHPLQDPGAQGEHPHAGRVGAAAAPLGRRGRRHRRARRRATRPARPRRRRSG